MKDNREWKPILSAAAKNVSNDRLFLFFFDGEDEKI